MRIRKIILGAALLAFTLPALANKLSVTMNLTQKPAESIGTIKVSDTDYGLLIVPDLHGLTPGLHGFHVHLKPDCADQGMAAGGHFDPAKTNKHLGPYNYMGHDGDLPALFVNKEGKAVLPVLAPRLTLADVKNHALIIHVGGDNYADKPEKLGGGGARFACGVVK